MNDLQSTESETPVADNASPKKSRRKLVTLIILAVAAVTVFFLFRDSLSLDQLAKREGQLKLFQSEHPVAVYVIAFLIYVVIAGLSLPIAAPLTLVFGWYFGFARGLLLVSFASTAGATMAFLSSRYLLGDWVQSKFGDRLKVFNERLDREGAFYLFTLRLIVGVPFVVINIVMGLTRIRVLTFWWVSQLGMLAGTAVFVWAGSSFPDLQTLADNGLSGGFSTTQKFQLGIAFAFLGLFPLATKKVMGFVMARRKNAA